MPEAADPPDRAANLPEEEDQKKRREIFSTLAKVYNDGCEQGGMEEGLRRLRAKLDELSPRAPARNSARVPTKPARPRPVQAMKTTELAICALMKAAHSTRST